MSIDPKNDPHPGDLENNLLRKILSRLSDGVVNVGPAIELAPGDVNIGSVTIKDAGGPDLVQVETSAPTAGEAGLVVRNIPSGTQTVAGTVAVSNFPATTAVSNFPASQTVNGAVSVAGSVAVTNFPATQPVTVSNFPATQPVSGTVAVSNFPATQPVSGAVSVAGSVAVTNFPATQPVSGTVAVSNFPATQPVSGSVSVSNFPVEASDPIFSAARTGLVDGKPAVAYHIQGRRAGFNSTSVLQDVAEFLGTSTDALPELTGVENLEVVSSSASDTAAGTGARTIRITYLDTSNNLVTSADITLNGVTAVALAFHANFILWMEVTTVGSNNVSVGTVLLRIAGAGATQEQITAGGNRSLSNRFKVPAGYTGYISTWQVSSIGAATQDARLRGTVRTADRALNGAYLFQDTAFVAGGSSVGDDTPSLAFPALSRIKVSTISSSAAATNRIDSDFTILLIAN